MRKVAFGIFVAGLLMLTVVACEGIDCTLNNVVTLNVGFYRSDDGSAYTIPDTLTITAEGTDSVLLNRAIRVKSISLPMSYWQEADTLRLHFYNTESSHEMTMRIEKSNTQHFESPDCPTTMFHEIKGMSHEGATGYVDSVVVTNKSIGYGALEHIKVYMHVAD